MYDIDARTANYAGNQRFPDEAFHFWAYADSPIRNVLIYNVYFPGTTAVQWNCSGVVQSKAGAIYPWPPCTGFVPFDDDDFSLNHLPQQLLLQPSVSISSSVLHKYRTAHCSYGDCALICAAAITLLFLCRTVAKRFFSGERKP
jgi:hypothetical protein